jgi:hypothetical protein
MTTSPKTPSLQKTSTTPPPGQTVIAEPLPVQSPIVTLSLKDLSITRISAFLHASGKKEEKNENVFISLFLYFFISFFLYLFISVSQSVS